MNTELLVATRSQQSLSERLYEELTPEEHETRAALFGRAAVIASEFKDNVLMQQDLAYMGRVLSNWEFYTTKLHTTDWGVKKMGIARRLITPNEKQLEIIKSNENRSPRKVFILRPSEVVLMAYPTLTGGDASDIFQIEEANEMFARTPALSLPSPKERSRGSNGSIGAAELRGSSGLYLTENDLDVIRLLPLSYAVSSERLDIEPGAVRKRITYAINRNKKLGEIDRPEEFLIKAVDGGLVEMKLLPRTKDYELDDLEQKVFKNYTFADSKVMAKDLQLSSKAAALDIWKVIYKKVGIAPPHDMNTQIHAFLIAKRDGKI